MTHQLTHTPETMQATTATPANLSELTLSVWTKNPYTYGNHKASAPAFIPETRNTKVKRANEAEMNLAWLMYDRPNCKRTLYKIRQTRALLALAAVAEKPADHRAAFFAKLASAPRPASLLDTANVLRWASLKAEAYELLDEARICRILFVLDLKIAARKK